MCENIYALFSNNINNIQCYFAELLSTVVHFQHEDAKLRDSICTDRENNGLFIVVLAPSRLAEGKMVQCAWI